MAYIEYIACDKCGVDMGAWVDRSFGICFARRYARKRGWKIGKNGWVCPECQRKKENSQKLVSK